MTSHESSPSPVPDNSLKLNDMPFSFSGVIGRKDYVTNSLAAAVAGFGGLAVLYVLSLASSSLVLLASGIIGTLGSLLFWIVFSLVFFGATCRRIRDVRGTTDDEAAWFLGAFILILSPLTGSILYAFLCVKQGIVTKPDTAVNLVRIGSALVDKIDDGIPKYDQSSTTIENENNPNPSDSNNFHRIALCLIMFGTLLVPTLMAKEPESKTQSPSTSNVQKKKSSPEQNKQVDTAKNSGPIYYFEAQSYSGHYIVIDPVDSKECSISKYESMDWARQRMAMDFMNCTTIIDSYTGPTKNADTWTMMRLGAICGDMQHIVEYHRDAAACSKSLKVNRDYGANSSGR